MTSKMGEVDTINANEDVDQHIVNGETTDSYSMDVDDDNNTRNVNLNSSETIAKKGSDEVTNGSLISNENHNSTDENMVTSNDDVVEEEIDNKSEIMDDNDEALEINENDDDTNDEDENPNDCDNSKKIDLHEKNNKSVASVQEVINDEDDDSDSNSKVIELNDSGDEETDDVVIIEPKENGSVSQISKKDDVEVIELDYSPNKSKSSKQLLSLTPRRSVRNINRQKSYVECEKELIDTTPQSSEESDIEEVVPQDPLAVTNLPKHKMKSSTIVVKDTKRLVEIASKSNSNNSGNKKEPTLVIIDTNSILSGRGPVPIGSKSSNTNHSSGQNYPALLPMTLPGQGMYPQNMRATITPIPISTSSHIKSSSPLTSISSTTSPTPILPTLTDDMFVVEAPSFIVPYVYEKPPMKELKQFVDDVKKKILESESEKNKDEETDTTPNTVDNNNADDSPDVEEVPLVNKESTTDDEKSPSYFVSPLGKFFIDIGYNLVQEFVQNDLLRQQKRKRNREGGHNPSTNKTIHSLMKTLEFSKENNEPFKIQLKKCEFCNFKTESALALAHHLETPHVKNYVYKCNFCPYEVRSPHEILFHMEAEHAVRGRLERAVSFHQCPNCPFEDNQKGKLSRHLVGCVRKFRPEKNMEPPLDWEPPAKIPRAPKSRSGLNASPYHAMKASQLQFLSKIQMLNANNINQSINRGRGRPAITPTNVKQMIKNPASLYKQQFPGGNSVLMPTNYQFSSGSQIYQQQLQAKNKPVHQPSISITPLPRQTSTSISNSTSKPGDTNSKNSFVICEICDGYIKDLEQLRNHMQWIHKVKIHPKMIYNRPPLNCQKCQFRFFTDQGLERHLLGSHGLVTSSMQDAANKSKDAGRCPVCGRVYQWKLLNHVARDHNMTLKPAHLSYKCTVCTATFGMYKQFENHVYSAHSVVTKRVMDKKVPSSTSNSECSGSKSEHLMKPLKINDEITIIPQPAKQLCGSSSKESNSLSITSSSHITIGSDGNECR